MTHTRFTFSVATFAVVLLAVACGAEGSSAPSNISGTSSSGNQAASAPTPTTQPTPAHEPPTVIPATPTPEPPTVVPATPTPAPPAATVTTEGCYDRGYAGIISRVNGVTTYGLVEPPDDPDDAARAVAETWCVVNGRFTPSGEVRVIKVNYTLKQLKAWYSLLNDQVGQIKGLWSSSVDQATIGLDMEYLASWENQECSNSPKN